MCSLSFTAAANDGLGSGPGTSISRSGGRSLSPRVGELPDHVLVGKGSLDSPITALSTYLLLGTRSSKSAPISVAI